MSGADFQGLRLEKVKLRTWNFAGLATLFPRGKLVRSFVGWASKMSCDVADQNTFTYEFSIIGPVK